MCHLWRSGITRNSSTMEQASLLIAVQYNKVLLMVHILYGHRSVYADDLPRLQVELFKSVHRGADRQPTQQATAVLSILMSTPYS